MMAALNLLSLLFILIKFSQGADFLGPATMTIQRFEKCGNNSLGFKMDIHVHRVNRTHQGVDVVMNAPFSLDDNIDLNTTISKWGDGGWKPHLYDQYNPSVCGFFMKYAKDQFEKLMSMVNKTASCPIPLGNYDIKNFVYDSELTVPVLYGEFMMDAWMTKDGVMFSCLRVFVKTSPKKVSLLNKA